MGEILSAERIEQMMYESRLSWPYVAKEIAASHEALRARLTEVEAERDRAWRECSKAQDESSVWFNKRAAAEGRAAKERSGRLAAEARLAEVEQALRELAESARAVVRLEHPTLDAWRRYLHADAAAAVLDKGEPT